MGRHKWINEFWMAPRSTPTIPYLHHCGIWYPIPEHFGGRSGAQIVKSLVIFLCVYFYTAIGAAALVPLKKLLRNRPRGLLPISGVG
jgi:hypothetical protein